MRRVGAGLELVPRSRDVHEDTPHQLDGYGEKCARIPPLHAARIHEAEVRLVDQRNGVERVAGPPAGHVAMRQAAELAVHARHELVQRGLVALTPRK